MINVKILTGLLLLLTKVSLAQKFDIGADAGWAYFHYQYKDYGHGYSNAPRANYGLIAGASLTGNLNKKSFIETGLKFVLYEQYYATRLYNTAWELSD